MSLNISSLVRRNMKSTGSFAICQNDEEYSSVIDLADGEKMIGCYRNPAPWEGVILWFSTEAIYCIEDSSQLKISFRDICSYELPKSKTNVTGLRVRTADKFYYLRMAGCRGPNGKYKDVFNFIMILKMIISNKGE